MYRDGKNSCFFWRFVHVYCSDGKLRGDLRARQFATGLLSLF